MDREYCGGCLQHLAGHIIPSAACPPHSQESPAAMAEQHAGLVLLDLGGKHGVRTQDGGDGKADGKAPAESGHDLGARQVAETCVGAKAAFTGDGESAGAMAGSNVCPSVGALARARDEG